MNFRELEKIIKADGWRLVEAEGSHYQYKHPTKPGKVTLAYHKGDLKRKTVRSVITQAGLKEQE
jgi:predicted RNA binding protein YcfA (HicA-like mRNA interferase family)